jgi:LysR family transcriptional activator of nhaA
VLNFNHLYYFHVVATLGSIKAAADKLGVTQPTVSEQLRMLERSLSVELFDRTPGGLRLTHSGRQAYEHTSAMFLAGERLVRSLGRDISPPEITLRVGMSASMARTIAADFLMPVLTVEGCKPYVRTGDFSELLRDLRSRELDLILGETEPAEVARSGLAVEPQVGGRRLAGCRATTGLEKLEPARVPADIRLPLGGRDLPANAWPGAYRHG